MKRYEWQNMKNPQYLYTMNVYKWFKNIEPKELGRKWNRTHKSADERSHFAKQGKRNLAICAMYEGMSQTTILQGFNVQFQTV